MMIRRLLLSFAFILALGSAVASPAAAATDPEKARALIDGMAQEAISTLSAPNRTDAQIADKFHAILKQNFDLPAVGRFVLGRYWRMATPEQQAEYTRLFEDYIVGIYANRFKAYSGETVSITGTRADAPDVVVNSKINLTGGQPPVAVDWKVSAVDDKTYRVTDVIIEQVSMSITQRSEFASIIQNNGGKVDALIALLRSKTGASANVAQAASPQKQ